MLNEFFVGINIIKIQMQNNIATLGIILLFPCFFYFVARYLCPVILLLGIIPRRLRGLPGIIFAPLLHANFNHLFFNSIPLLVLSAFILINGLYYYGLVTLYITLLSGSAIWLFAKNGLYIGASALITGYWGFLITNLYQDINPISIILGILSLYYFGGIFLGLFPQQKGISWQGHLLGLFAGILTSFIIN
ncbi:MAG: rhomboid family intramembrane serine protease [Legionella sp.]|nr:MAG: rhomboid family intramembrane serine protease [Legionella sp.]PJD99786.1 MAG: rhomboid family intramembrane serine protease [Legionella sp.]